MSALTQARNTIELHVSAIRYNRELEVASGETVFSGALVAQNSSEKAVPASDAANLIVLGRAEKTMGAGGKVLIRSGVFLFDNGSDSEALAAADIGSAAYVVDDHTVGKVGGTNKVPAGIVIDVTADGVAVEVTPTAIAGAKAQAAAAAVAATVAAL